VRFARVCDYAHHAATARSLIRRRRGLASRVGCLSDVRWEPFPFPDDLVLVVSIDDGLNLGIGMAGHHDEQRSVGAFHGDADTIVPNRYIVEPINDLKACTRTRRRWRFVSRSIRTQATTHGPGRTVVRPVATSTPGFSRTNALRDTWSLAPQRPMRAGDKTERCQQ
jgi:hypothetical protein